MLAPWTLLSGAYWAGLINELLGTVLAGYDKVILGFHCLNWYAVYQYNVHYGKLHNIHMYL